MMYVPRGFAHGFLTLRPDTEGLFCIRPEIGSNAPGSEEANAAVPRRLQAHGSAGSRDGRRRQPGAAPSAPQRPNDSSSAPTNTPSADPARASSGSAMANLPRSWFSTTRRSKSGEGTRPRGRKRCRSDASDSPSPGTVPRTPRSACGDRDIRGPGPRQPPAEGDAQGTGAQQIAAQASGDQSYAQAGEIATAGLCVLPASAIPLCRLISRLPGRINSLDLR